MATLSLDFSPVSRTGSAKVPKPLTAIGQVSFEGPHSFVASRYYYSHRSAVFRGEIRADKPDAQPEEVVCKYREEDVFELEREANFYQNNLRELQGVVVPHFHGLYKGSRVDDDDEERTVVCLILEYFPADRSVPYWKRPLETKEDVAYSMLELHFAGLNHNNFDDDHILVSERGEVRIIDFDQATAHTCNAKDDINVWGSEQSEVKFGCIEMCEVIKLLELWTPVFVPLQGTEFWVFSYPTPDLLVERYVSRMGTQRDPAFEERLRQEAKEVLDEYYAKYADRFKNIGHPVDIKKKVDERRQQRFEKERQRLQVAGESSA
ncbi:hypothetical protein PsYK624_080280 [Phanerochaete sordida]|uniref:Protein kinase domain-containing protein n=1 Tax=Phanerochaete sordida TaxID=48140 RepID=A0A9P3GC25_9APHY|nr:hypothetical protein PsYK624_080280 [Phanerochaete sordida]